ncbi:MAG: hypothetical protein MK085_00855 [Phycisphaerales bacterium]|nr:hypothetical protein [Phycisphaerales bacterium]
MNRIKRFAGPSFIHAGDSPGWRTRFALAMGLMIAGGCLISVNTEARAGESITVQDEGRDQADDGMLYSEKKVTSELKQGIRDGYLSEEDADRIMAMWERFAMGVESGRMTSQQARQKFDERMEAMFADGGRKEPARDEAARSNRFGKMMIELGKAVDSGEMTPEQAVRRVMDMAERMKIGKGQPEMSAELQELKDNIQKRIDAMGEDLERKVKDGEITEEQAAERFKQGETRMWQRFRAAEMQAMKDGGGERTREMSKAEYDDAVADMIEMVKAGKITREQMQQRLERMKMSMQADGKNPADQRQRRAEYAEAEKKMAEMVKAGEITREDMERRLGEMRRAMADGAKSEEKPRLTKERYNEAVEKMTEMVRAGEITREDMERRLGEMRRAMAAGAQDDGKGRELPMPPEGATPEETREWFGRMRERLEKAVEAGRMTQDQADEMLRDIRMNMRGGRR